MSFNAQSSHSAQRLVVHPSCRTNLLLIRKPFPFCLPDAIVHTIPLRSDLHRTLSALICWPIFRTGGLASQFCVQPPSVLTLACGTEHNATFPVGRRLAPKEGPTQDAELPRSPRAQNDPPAAIPHQIF